MPRPIRNQLILHRAPGLSGPFMQPIGGGRFAHVPAGGEIAPLEAFRSVTGGDKAVGGGDTLSVSDTASLT